MVIQSRADLRAYIRRRLGEPVIKVNIADTQLDDRIDDAFALYQDYHFDAVERIYLKHQISPSSLTLFGAPTGSFSNNETIVGATSNAHARVFSANDTVIQYTSMGGTFANGETITGASSGATGVASGTPTLGDFDQQSIPIPEHVIFCVRLLRPPAGAVAGIGDMFYGQSQGWFNELYPFLSQSLVPYYMVKQHLDLMQQILVGLPQIEFSRHANRLHIYWQWGVDANVGDWIIVECYRILDPACHADVWNDRWLREYATALSKQQWGQNLMKYEGVALPGNVTLNGTRIYEEGSKEKEKLEDELQLRYEEPPRFFSGAILLPLLGLLGQLGSLLT